MPESPPRHSHFDARFLVQITVTILIAVGGSYMTVTNSLARMEVKQEESEKRLDRLEGRITNLLDRLDAKVRDLEVKRAQLEAERGVRAR